MKKLIVYIMSLMLITLTLTPIQVKAEKDPVSISATGNESPELKAIIDRVNEINAMDRSTMSRSEKKEIRKELRALKREAHRHDGGGAVFISGGLLIFILVLLIVF